MTTQEFSLEFDLLYNNLMSNQAPGLNEYEKSLLLTEAQETLVTSLYNGSANFGFETNELMRDSLSSLLEEYTVALSAVKSGGRYRVGVNLPDDAWYKVYESAVIADSSLECCGSDERECEVFPVTHNTFYRTNDSPFRGPNERRVLRLDSGKNRVELVSSYPLASYTVRYLHKPTPIVLIDLPEGLSVDGVSVESGCGLHDSLHRTIVSNAVALAKTMWVTGTAAESSSEKNEE